jgi:hypothetical protein
VSLSLKIFSFEPARRLLLVPSSGPLPQTYEDGVVHAMKNVFAHHVPVIVGPAPYFWVEPINQIGGRHAQGGFDRPPDAIQEGFDVLLGRLNEQFPVGILAHILSEEVEALFHVRNDRLRGRKFQPSFVQKLLDEGFDFSFQQFFRSTGDDEIIRVTDEINTGRFTSKGEERSTGRELLLQEPLQSIQRTVGERWRNNSALWRPFRSFVEDVLIQVPGF